MALDTQDRTPTPASTREIQLEIVERTAGLTGAEYFAGLTRSLTEILGVRFAFLTRWQADGLRRLRTVSLHDGKRILDNFDYPLGGSPCEIVIRDGEYHCAEGVSERFPGDRALAELGVESYLGVSLRGSEDQVLGHLCIMDEKPMHDLEARRDILDLFAFRAAAELERIQSAEALRASEERFRRLAESLPGVVFSYRQESGGSRELTYMGPGAETLLGHELMLRLERDLDQFVGCVHPDDLPELLKGGERAAASGRPYVPQFRARIEGDYRWLEASCQATSQEDGSRLWSGVLYDIDDRRAAEDQLRDYSQALEESNGALQEVTMRAQAATRSKNEFLANMSHEIRTPMTAILGYADILAERLREPESAEALGIIQDHGRYLLQIINDILDLSTIETGRLELNHQRISIFQLLHHVAELMRVRAHEKGLSLTVEYETDMPAVMRTDPVRMRQILVNMLSNAIKFTERGGVRIVARFHNEDVTLPTLEIEVQDSGVGMNEEQIRNLFQPFNQVDGTHRRRYGGTGLGLSISKRLAEMLGGTIGVRSREGKGSSFRLTVGAGMMDDLKMISRDEGMAFLDIHDEPLRDAERLDLRILLAEDNRTNQRLIRHVLEKLGAWVAVVENGREAVDGALAAKQAGDAFDVILMDIQMPGMDGLEATRELRRRGYDAPIVALTAHALEMDREACLAAGCDDHCTKPIDRRKLVSTILNQLSPSRA